MKVLEAPNQSEYPLSIDGKGRPSGKASQPENLSKLNSPCVCTIVGAKLIRGLKNLEL